MNTKNKDSFTKSGESDVGFPSPIEREDEAVVSDDQSDSNEVLKRKVLTRKKKLLWDQKVKKNQGTGSRENSPTGRETGKQMSKITKKKNKKTRIVSTSEEDEETPMQSCHQSENKDARCVTSIPGCSQDTVKINSENEDTTTCIDGPSGSKRHERRESGDGTRLILKRAAKGLKRTFSDDSMDFRHLDAEDLAITKKRGRPISTGEYVGLAAAKKLLTDTSRDAMIHQIEQEAFQLAKGATGILNARLDEGGMATAVTADLKACIIEATDSVLKISKISRGLKGTSVGILKRAANSARIAAEELCTRVYERQDGNGPNVQEEISKLSEKLKKAEEENNTLKKEINDLKLKVDSMQRDKVEPPKEQRQRKSRTLQQQQKNDWTLDPVEGMECENNLIENQIQREDKFMERLMNKLGEMMEDKIDNLKKELAYSKPMLHSPVMYLRTY